MAPTCKEFSTRYTVVRMKVFMGLNLHAKMLDEFQISSVASKFLDNREKARVSMLENV